MDIDFTVRLRVVNAIDEEALREDYDNDLLKFIRYLVQEEGLIGCVEDEYEILTAEPVSA